MPYTATLTVVVPVTAVPTRITQGPLAWHGTETELILRGHATAHVTEPLKTFGFGSEDEVLTNGHTYQLSGPFGQRPTGEAVIKHSALTQADLGVVAPPEHAHLAGKAMISGIGKVVSFEMDDITNEDGEWNLTIEAEHHYFDPETRNPHDFIVTYHFGHFTPPMAQWRHIKKDAPMWFNGTIVSKHPASNRFTVQVLNHATFDVLLGEEPPAWAWALA